MQINRVFIYYVPYIILYLTKSRNANKNFPNNKHNSFKISYKFLIIYFSIILIYYKNILMTSSAYLSKEHNSILDPDLIPYM